MKKISLYILAMTTLIITSCDSDEKLVEQVIDDITSSAILRTRTLEGNPYNAFVPESALTIVGEVQNGREGTDVTSVDLYGAFNGGTEQLLQSFTPAEFTDGERGLPELSYSTTLGESATALSVASYTGGDVFSYRFVMNLSDGTSWTNTNGNGNITGGSYFSSPYLYNISVSCIPVDPVPGEYKLSMQDSFGDGWNGASVRLTLNGTSTDYFIADGPSATETITVPADASTWKWEFISGDWDSEITFDITAPNGEEAYADGPTPTVGELVLNICP